MLAGSFGDWPSAENSEWSAGTEALAVPEQPERRPATRPARPREAILRRFRLVREAGRKRMSLAPRCCIRRRTEERVSRGIQSSNDTFEGLGL